MRCPVSVSVNLCCVMNSGVDSCHVDKRQIAVGKILAAREAHLFPERVAAFVAFKYDQGGFVDADGTKTLD